MLNNGDSLGGTREGFYTFPVTCYGESMKDAWNNLLSEIAEGHWDYVNPHSTLFDADGPAD